MEKTYKNYKVTRTTIRTIKTISTTEILAENELLAKESIDKQLAEERNFPLRSLRGSGECDSGTLLSVNEKIEIEEMA